MKKYAFKYQTDNGSSKNALYAISGSDIETLEELWVKWRGRPFDSYKGYGMMRDFKDTNIRLFEDFSGLLGKQEGELFVDIKNGAVYITGKEVQCWFLQIEVLNGDLKKAFAKEMAIKLANLKSNSPLIIVRDLPVP